MRVRFGTLARAPLPLALPVCALLVDPIVVVIIEGSFPTGTTTDEWEEWVERMARVVVHEFMLLRIALILRSDGIQAKSLVQECATYSFMPFLTS